NLINYHLDLNKRIVSSSEIYSELKNSLNLLLSEIKEKENIKNKSIQNIERFERLSNDYKNDIAKIKSGISAKKIIGGVVSENISCPVCESIVHAEDLSEKFELSSDVRLKSELTSLNRRVRNIESLILQNKIDLEAANLSLSKLYAEEDKARVAIDEELKSSVSPYLAERDAIVGELAQVDVKRDKLIHSL